jgi:hypothetical protein
VGRFGHVRITLLAVIAVSSMVAAASAAGEPQRTIDMSRVFDAGAPHGDAPISAIAPDPPPLTERRQWLLDLRWDRGDVWLLGARRADMHVPRETPRTMGRFALELYEGPALLERVRFDFPLLGADFGEAGDDDHPPSLTLKLRTRVGVLFPATPRGTNLELRDRKTGVSWSLPWPPPEAEVPDAGADGGPTDQRRLTTKTET